MSTVAPSTTASTAPPDHNRTGVDYRRPMPRPKVRGAVVDFHCHLVAARHARVWFDAAAHYGIDRFCTMTPLEEAAALLRAAPGRVHLIVVPKWQESSPWWVDNWLRRLEAFYNLGSRIVKFHCSPRSWPEPHRRIDSPALDPLFAEIKARGMAVMSHVGDPDTWYASRYADPAKYATRDDHYLAWEHRLDECRGLPWIGAHLGGNPENLPRLQVLLDRFEDLSLDCSATKWMVREISARRDQAREFFIRNQDRILFGSDQVSDDKRGWDFLASRFWAHRKLWETAAALPSPIHDPDLPDDAQPELRGLALPDETLQKLYHDNAARLLARIGGRFE